MIRYFIILSCIIFTVSCSNKNLLEEVKTFPNYPSASGIEYINKKFYIIGDDAKNILILDSSLNKLDSISLYPFSEQRIPKSVKSDLESITFTEENKLLLLGSGSFSPYRNIGWLINPITKEKEFIHLDTFYQRLQLNELKELNLEGACSIPGAMLLSNRGSKGFPKNHLIITSKNFWQQQEAAPIATISVGTNNDSTKFTGISGLCYSIKSDNLLLTVSTEDTQNNLDDGAIGKSYLWIIKNISSKKKWKAVNPNKIIDLEEIDPRFKGQKIESICITEETKNLITLVVVADNDNGNSTFFKIRLEKE